MILYYGIKGTELLTNQSTKVCICQECGNDDKMINTLYARYFHLYGMPFFSLGKKIQSQCQFCYQSFSFNKVPQVLKKDYDSLKRNTKVPLRHFAGLLILGIIFLLLWMSYTKKIDKEMALLSNPFPGDIYEYRTKTDGFSTYKVISVADDTIVYLKNDFAVNTSNGITKIEKDNYYSKQKFVITINELKIKFRNGEIYKIIRSKKSK